jgi:catechol 2,3-dioxygenase-like lactoylglutathione lyase family enzyme
MFAKINHVAIVSEKYALLNGFYQSLFGLKPSKTTGPQSGVDIGDGYVGLNINPRKGGRPAGLDHFGVEVEDVQTAFDRMRERYPLARWVERPSNRPFAGITANDPDGNVFDLSQKSMSNRSGAYVENTGEQQGVRYISHVAIRTVRPDEMARFYVDVLELAEQNASYGDPNHYLTDGKMTLTIIPWRIDNYANQSIMPTGVDHFGFSVESIELVMQDIDRLVGMNPVMHTIPLGMGPEGRARLELAHRQFPMADHFIADPDYNLIALRERKDAA